MFPYFSSIPLPPGPLQRFSSSPTSSEEGHGNNAIVQNILVQNILTPDRAEVALAGSYNARLCTSPSRATQKNPTVTFTTASIFHNTSNRPSSSKDSLFLPEGLPPHAIDCGEYVLFPDNQEKESKSKKEQAHKKEKKTLQTERKKRVALSFETKKTLQRCLQRHVDQGKSINEFCYNVLKGLVAASTLALIFRNKHTDLLCAPETPPSFEELQIKTLLAQWERDQRVNPSSPAPQRLTPEEKNQMLQIYYACNSTNNPQNPTERGISREQFLSEGNPGHIYQKKYGVTPQKLKFYVQEDRKKPLDYRPYCGPVPKQIENTIERYKKIVEKYKLHCLTADIIPTPGEWLEEIAPDSDKCIPLGTFYGMIPPEPWFIEGLSKRENQMQHTISQEPNNTTPLFDAF